MNNLKVIVAAVITACSMGFATAGYAYDGGPACNGQLERDKVFIGGVPDCIRIREDNGWGNGDDAAPGESLLTNNAENQCSSADETGCTASPFDIADGNPDGAESSANPSNPNSEKPKKN